MLHFIKCLCGQGLKEKFLVYMFGIYSNILPFFSSYIDFWFAEDKITINRWSDVTGDWVFNLALACC